MTKELKFHNLNPNGVVLVIVLWVITILSVIVLEFCFAMRTEMNLTKNFKEDIECYAMAEGGIERAILELIYKNDLMVQTIRKTLKQEDTSSEDKEWLTDGRPYTLSYSNGTCEIRIMGEGGKLNINRISEAFLRRIIGNLGLEDEKRDIIVDSILDWRDPDDFYRLNGAENDYYQSLKEPYQCKNGNLDSIEELLLIRGVIPEIFYGKSSIWENGEAKVDQVGLRDIFSIYSIGEQIDINSATPFLLRYGLGIPEDISQLIYNARGEKPFENQADLLRRVPEINPLWQDISRFILFRTNIPYYTIEVKAKKKEGKLLRGVKTIVKIDPREEKGYKIIQWIDVAR